jgi:hypothetical protein
VAAAPLNPNTNRRNGLKHEGRVRKWFQEAGFTCLNLASNSAADLLLFDKRQRSFLLEVKRLKVSQKRRAYYPSVNPEQKKALADLPNAWYAVSFYGIRPTSLPVTRFVGAKNVPTAIAPDSGCGWDTFVGLLE